MVEQIPSKKRFSWLLHLLLFALFQITFILFDGSEVWIIFNLNKTGEWVVSHLDWLFTKFQMYNSGQLNIVTVVWGSLLILHIVIWIIEKLSYKYKKTI